ncbi:unnamed protein product [Cylicocyclus nassatus]|uniref:Zinc finger protein-like 1 homolog n=1 Tax=Cylicocyclus nassatus TaxID=53992 RepID=A0AA36DRI8_CYLNA|nr:unnamed protein product [Cylicocyclus nassatus]
MQRCKPREKKQRHISNCRRLSQRRHLHNLRPAALALPSRPIVSTSRQCAAVNLDTSEVLLFFSSSGFYLLKFLLRKMGLCKCPRKKVTNLFCFEHRVNVCEHCLVENHHGCVVQSYLQWLTDCDYDTNCSLCERPLAEAETIRLQCLHLLHWSCLDQWARRFPATTAPAGYCCPFCREALFPALNQTSPMIDELRAKLQQANWARAGLGLPLLPELDPPHMPPQQTHTPGPQKMQQFNGMANDMQPLLSRTNDRDSIPQNLVDVLMQKLIESGNPLSKRGIGRRSHAARRAASPRTSRLNFVPHKTARHVLSLV